MSSSSLLDLEDVVVGLVVIEDEKIKDFILNTELRESIERK